MLRTILVFFDGSAESRKAFNLGLEVAVRFEAEVVILRVLAAVEIDALLDQKKDYPVRELRDLCLEARDRGINCRYRADVGDTVERIIQASGELDANLLIVNRKPLTPWQLRIQRVIDAAGSLMTVV